MVRSQEALELAATDQSLRVLVLTGAGVVLPGCPNHFTPRPTRADVAGLPGHHLLHEIPAVTVAAEQCAGAGMGWALAATCG